jgi:protoporphyrinogen oxidase
MRSQQRSAFIYHSAHGIYTRFPFQAHLYGLPVTLVRDCLVDLIAAVERRARGEFAPTNYEEWMRGFFGDAIAERLMIPYARKLWTVEPTTMEFSWIGRRVPTPDVERIVLGALTDDVAEIGATANFWYPWRGGAEALPAALALRVGGVNLGSSVERVDLRGRTLHLAGGERVAFDRLLWTLPLMHLATYVRDLPPRVEDACRRLAYQGILNINLGIRRADVSTMHWVYFYEDAFPFHRLSFPATFSPHNVPEGCSSIATEVAFPPGRPPSHDEALEQTLAALRTAGIVEPDEEPEVVHVHEVEPAYVIYSLDHADAVETIRSWLREQRVWTAGRFGEWAYLNMDHAMRSGRDAAAAIIAARNSR